MSNDLIERLHAWARHDTAQSEFGPDEHIAGIAADALEAKDQEIERLMNVCRHWKIAEATWDKDRVEVLEARVAELEAALVAYDNPGQTHSEECWRWHGHSKCAERKVAELEAEPTYRIRQEQAERIAELEADLALLRPVCSADSGGLAEGLVCPKCKGQGLVQALGEKDE